MLNGLWKTNSSLPVERLASIQNAQSAYLAAHPVNALDFPWKKEQLPGDFRSPAWAAVKDPVSNGEPACAVPWRHPSRKLTHDLGDEEAGAEPVFGILHQQTPEQQGCGMCFQTMHKECVLLPCMPAAAAVAAFAGSKVIALCRCKECIPHWADDVGGSG